MFFFKVEISSFDDAAKTLFIVPEQHTDEQGVPFEDKMLTQTADFKQFVKSTQTCMVDGKYTQYKTDGVFESITEQQFEQLKVEGKVEELDSNSFSISTGFSPKKGGGKKDFKTLLIIGGAAIVLIALLIFSSMSGGGKSDVSETTESTETVETTSTEETESTDAPETSESSPAESESKPSETTTSSTENSEYVDEPTDTTSEPTDEANEDGYTDSGYSGGSSSSSGGSGIYTISFNLNGGTGTLDSISENAGQYVVLPSAEEAAKTVSKKGYKLIGFSDNTEIAYPLYHYKMPYENVTLFAVWEPDTFYVTYNSNGGTGQLSKAAVKYGADVPLPTDISVYKDGLYLTGWAKTDGAKTALKTLAMPAENLTLYAVWSEKKPTAKITLHFDDKVQIVEKEIGSTVDMLDSFGVFKDGYAVEGWYLENSPERLESLYLSEDCDVYAKWQTAKYITITIDRSYLNKKAEAFKVPCDMTGTATLKLPTVDDKSDIYNSVFGCTYGFSDKKQTGEFGTIKYFGGTECEFTKDTTLYRVLNEYGGGNGTKENTYIISYYDQLIRLSEEKASGYFIQTADIKFPSDVKRIPIDTKKISRGYENKSYDFFVYDGQGFAIKNLYGNGGLFGDIAGSTIKNVVIDGAKIKSGDYDNVGVLVNRVISYSFKSSEGNDSFGTGNSKIQNCTVRNSKIEGEGAENIGGLVGNGGSISYCYASEVSVEGGKSVGGIVGNACTVSGCLANGITTSGNISSAGGICGTAYGTEIFDDGEKSYMSGGTIIGCGVRTFTSKATNSGGIVGTATADTNSAYIKSCYAANIYLNGENNGGIVGADGKYKAHRIVYCLVDNANSYAVVGGDNTDVAAVASECGAGRTAPKATGDKVRSISKRMVLSVPADSGLTVDGVLSVLNAAGSGFDKWERSENINGGYPYPSKITF